MRTHNCGSSFENHCNTHICSNGDTIVGTIKRGSFFANLFRHPHNHNCSAPYPLGEKHTTTKIKVVEILIVILLTSSGTHTTIIAPYPVGRSPRGAPSEKSSAWLLFARISSRDSCSSPTFCLLHRPAAIMCSGGEVGEQECRSVEEEPSREEE